MDKIKGIVILLISGMAAGGAFGYVLAQMEGINIILAFPALVAGYILNIILHELGHMIAGLISGYKFCSFRIFNVTWVVEEGKIKKKIFSIQGTAGQCLMIPPEGKGLDYPVVFYNLGGVIMNFITAVIFIALGFVVDNQIFFIMALPGIFFLILNGIPLKINGMPNDGENAFHLKKNKAAMKSMDTQLRCNALEMEGVRLKEMPAQWFEMEDEPDWKNIHVCSLAYFNLCRKLELNKYEECESEIKELLDKDTALVEIYRNELKCELISMYIKENRYHEAEKLYREMEGYLKKTMMFLEHYPLMYGYWMLVRENEEEAQKLLEAYKKKRKTYPYKSAIIAADEEIDNILCLQLSCQM